MALEYRTMAAFVIGDIVECQSDRRGTWDRGQITRITSLGLDAIFGPIYMVNFDNDGPWPCLEKWLRRAQPRTSD